MFKILTYSVENPTGGRDAIKFPNPCNVHPVVANIISLS